ncbi:MAG: SpoIIE family protein phosphatase [Clostridia bacterium]|nr:SpoIIE family protein phosphatase [Clostridia bacterium]
MNKGKNEEFKARISGAAAAAGDKLTLLRGRITRMREFENAERILRGIGWSGAAFLIGKTVIAFGAQPLGLALLCSAPEYIPYIAISLMISALTSGSGLLLAAVIGTVGIRILVRCVIEPPDNNRISDSLFSESVYLRMATAACASFAVGFGNMISDGFYFYDLWGATISMLISPIAVILYLPLFKKNEILLPDIDDIKGKILADAGYYALLLSLSASVRDTGVLGIAPVHSVICLCTLFTLRRRGLWQGVLAGAICGLAAGIPFAPLYAVSAVIAYLLMGISPLAAATSFTVCGAVYCAVSQNTYGLVGLFPSQLIGVVIFTAADFIICKRNKGIAVSSDDTGINESAEGSGTDPRRNVLSEDRERMAELSEAFAKIADVYTEFSRNQARPSISELREICDKACDRVCPTCPEQSRCWDLEYATTLDVIGKLCASIRENGRANPDSIPSFMRDRCRYLTEISAEVEYAAAGMLRRRLADSRLDIISEDSRAVSRALAQALEEDRLERRSDPARTEAVRTVLERAGAACGRISVTGKRCLHIRVDNADLSHVHTGVNDLRHQLEVATGHRLSPFSFVTGDRHARLELDTRRRFGTAFAAARSSAGTEPNLCGDAVCRIETPDGFLYAAICDGMGTGQDASSAAEACCDLLRRTLGAGMCVESALEMLSSLLRSSPSECSVGIDLLRIDLLNGNASLWKSGASATYLRRCNKVCRIDSESEPIGILGDAQTCRTDFDVAEGDVILISSDGIGQEDTWIPPLMRQIGIAPSGSPVRNGSPARSSASDAVRRVIREARSRGSRDDISAAVVVVNAEADTD